jgi:hypothetical protein
MGPLQGPPLVGMDHTEVGLLHLGQKLYLPPVPHFRMDWDPVHHHQYNAKFAPQVRAYLSRG